MRFGCAARFVCELVFGTVLSARVYVRNFCGLRAVFVCACVPCAVLGAALLAARAYLAFKNIVFGCMRSAL